MTDERVSASRVGRAMRMTGAAAAVAGREITGRMISSAAPDGNEALTRQQLKSAKALVKVFSGMRGAAMKVGQTLSAVDLGLVPAEVRPEFQEILATLQQDAKPVAFSAIRRVIEQDLDAPIAELFAHVDQRPLAAASIGQVHRGRLHDGREVAIKVQYPGIAEAVHADLRNLKLGLKLLTAIAPGIDTGAIADEVRERIGEELDYELEAANHREMARIYRGHPFIVVPDVITSLCRERVLVSEYLDAMRFAQARETLTPEQRDRAGETIVRFYLNGPLRHRLLNGDPHPGNCLFYPDGRVAFVDFGFTKHLDDRSVRQLIASTQATYHGDPQQLLAVVSELGALPPDPALAEPFFENYSAIFGWLLSEERLAADPSKTADMMARYTRMRREGFDDLVLPAEHFVLVRSVFLLIGALASLGSSNVWLDIVREWLLDEPPPTELGRQEAAFFASRFDYLAPVAA
ncbi:AarF/ABC1/UbiB kinase family protein [Conexibacter sp. DBS9H8]|uniref:ABC1 kinase family protein n=1 Tax=Conexibacter sp. DBS9H8 TaxID=2937801 RepID=UPI00200DD256|nr:AarF/ABC1/UbiB kinase family protein [Conexibacter sp. DBS9H8]